jgi:hypothetical protein
MSAAPKTEWWPRLGFAYVGGLDNPVTVYNREGLLKVAHALESDDAHRTPAAMSAASILEHIANTSTSAAIIEKMNHHRPQVPRKILGMNRAAHYLVRRERINKDAQGDVAQIWGVAGDTIRDDYGDYGKDARRIVATLIDDMFARPEAPPRAKILEDFDADMVERAKRMTKNT